MTQSLEAKAKKKKDKATGWSCHCIGKQVGARAFVFSGVAAALNYGWETGVMASADPVVWPRRETMRVGDGAAE